MESFLDYNFKASSFKITDRFLKNQMITLPVCVFGEQKFGVLFLLILAHLDFLWVSEKVSKEVLWYKSKSSKAYVNM